jgi:hypothetical protein
MLKRYFAELGETMPDGRSRRGNVSSGKRASGHANNGIVQSQAASTAINP